MKGRLGFAQLVLLFALMLVPLFGATPSALATPDATAPMLRSLSLTPSTVVIGPSGGQIAVEARVTDDISGVDSVVFQFQSPSGQNCSAFISRISGTSLDGVWRGTGSFGPYAEAGTWNLIVMTVRDVAGNWKDYSFELSGMGFPSQITVANAGADSSAPVLRSLAVSPLVVDTWGVGGQVSVEARVTDGISGVESVVFQFQSPSGQNCSAFIPMVSGTSLDGVWRGTGTLGPYAEAGTWSLIVMTVRDVAGNWRNYASELSGLGFPSQITVTNVPDTFPPHTNSDALTTYVVRAQIQLSASDIGAGVASTYYRLDGGSQTAGDSVTTSAAGDHVLEFWSVDKAGNEEVPHKSVAFSVTYPSPTLSGFTPASGSIGRTIILTGTGLSWTTSVEFNRTRAKFTVNSETEISAVVPSAASSGAISVTTPGGQATSSASFLVIPRPILVRLSPASGRAGTIVTLTGSGFGAARGTSRVKFGTTKVAKYVSWSATRIKCRVPARARFGRVKVTVTTVGGTSSARTFTVKR